MPNYTHEGPNLYLTSDRSQVVPEGDARAAFLLVASGAQLAEADARQYGLIDDKGKPQALKSPAEGKGSTGVVQSTATDPAGELQAARARIAELEQALAATQQERDQALAHLSATEPSPNAATVEDQGSATDEQAAEGKKQAQPATDDKSRKSAPSNKSR